MLCPRGRQEVGHIIQVGTNVRNSASTALLSGFQRALSSPAMRYKLVFSTFEKIKLTFTQHKNQAFCNELHVLTQLCSQKCSLLLTWRPVKVFSTHWSPVHDLIRKPKIRMSNVAAAAVILKCFTASTWLNLFNSLPTHHSGLKFRCSVHSLKTQCSASD